MKQQVRTKKGVFGRFRRAWVNSGTTAAVLYVRNDPEAEYGNDVSISLSSSMGRVELHLTQFTLEELEALHRLFEISFEAARPIVDRRDQVAREALEDGITEYARAFRPEAVLWLREGGQFSETMEELPRMWYGKDGEAHERRVGAVKEILASDEDTHEYRGVD